jgi:uncharacterized alkaline shock family protein YloU
MAQKTELGTLQIRNEVIGNIASLAAKEVEGVSSIRKGFFPFLSWCGLPSVRTEIREQEVRLWLSLVVEHGVNIPVLAASVQERVREMVERMTGLAVAEVHVKIHHVQPKRS